MFNVGCFSTFFIQISREWCLLDETVNGDEHSDQCERLYAAKAAELIIYGRALGLSHGEAEDVLQETFLALMQKPQLLHQPEHYCMRSFRNRAESPAFVVAAAHPRTGIATLV